MAWIWNNRCHLSLPQDEMAMIAGTFLECGSLFLVKG